MALNIEDGKTEALVARIVELTGETETVAVRKAVRERLERLTAEARPRKEVMTGAEVEDWLATNVWPKVPKAVLGKTITKADREEILGYGPEGF
jgi:antitoxin VapB